MEFTFDGIRFSSKFDSGNLGKVQKVSNEEYSVWTRNDCQGTEFANKNSTWFYFSVSGAKAGQTIKFNILNLNNQRKMFSLGMKPVFRSLPSKPTWDRIKTECVLGREGEPTFSFSFKHRFDNASDITYFAFSYPFSYTEYQHLLGELTERFSTSKSIYFFREVLTYSPEGRNVDLVTITGQNGISTEREATIEGLFPRAKETLRPLTCDKPIFFLSARVHPGETPASHVFNGFLEFILNENDKRAKLLRENFVFKLIPILNPDGVYHGHYRTDLRGENLNRVYDAPDPILHPSIYAIKTILRKYTEEKRLHFYVDLHGHAAKRGCFIYGNSIENIEQQVNNVLFARLMSVNSQHFDFSGCNFSEKNMTSKDKEGMTKCGTSRVSLYLESGLVNSYTLECNYNTGRIVNTAVPLPQAAESQCIKDPKAHRLAPKYTPETFAEVGKALAISLLDYYNLNPFSKLPYTPFKTLASLKQWLYKFILKKPKYWGRAYQFKPTDALFTELEEETAVPSKEKKSLAAAKQPSTKSRKPFK